MFLCSIHSRGSPERGSSSEQRRQHSSKPQVFLICQPEKPTPPNSLTTIHILHVCHGMGPGTSSVRGQASRQCTLVNSQMPLLWFIMCHMAVLSRHYTTVHTRCPPSREPQQSMLLPPPPHCSAQANSTNNCYNKKGAPGALTQPQRDQEGNCAYSLGLQGHLHTWQKNSVIQT